MKTVFDLERIRLAAAKRERRAAKWLHQIAQGGWGRAAFLTFWRDWETAQ